MSDAVIGALRAVLGLDTAQFDEGVKRVRTQMGGLQKAFAALGGIAVFAGVAQGVGDAVGRMEEMAKLSRQLDRALQNTGNTARTSAKEVEAFADRLEYATGRAAEEIVAVSTNLATFGFGRETFYRAIELANDMAAAWGGDLKQNVEGLGRALAEPEKGLAMLVKRGITFDAQQKQQIANFMKVNDLAGAQGVIFEALEGQVKGVAEAGFGGLPAAIARAQIAAERFFEAIAGGIGAGGIAAAAFTALAAGINLVTDNLDTIVRAAGVVGTALLTALGPSIAATIATAAGVVRTAVVGALAAIRAAVLVNPIGALVVGFTTAVSAAFLFRDEIKKAIGIDFVGIAYDAANDVIGLFVGAFNAIRDTWGLLPQAFGDLFVKAMNGAIGIVEVGVNGIIGALRNLPGLGDLGDVDLSGYRQQEGDALATVLDVVQKSFVSAFSVDYLGPIKDALTSLFGAGAESANTFAASLPAVADGMAAVAEGSKKAKEQTAHSFEDMAHNIGGALKSIFGENKAVALATVAIDTGVAIMKTLAQGGMWAMPSAIAIGIQGAAQAAAIAASNIGSPANIPTAAAPVAATAATPARQVGGTIVVHGSQSETSLVEGVVKGITELINTDGATELVLAVQRASR